MAILTDQAGNALLDQAGFALLDQVPILARVRVFTASRPPADYGALPKRGASDFSAGRPPADYTVQPGR